MRGAIVAIIRRLNYQHLLYFWSVVRTGSLTRACEELALSAPTISMQLRTLEERLGGGAAPDRAAAPRVGGGWGRNLSPKRGPHLRPQGRRRGVAPGFGQHLLAQ